MNKEFDKLFEKWGLIRDLDPLLIKAVACHESSLNPWAKASDGLSVGLMQIQASTAVCYCPWIQGDNDLLDPEVSIQAGSGFLAEMIKRFGLHGGIQAYNVGPRGYEEGKKNGRITEHGPYLTAVLKIYEELKKEGQ
jgi:membrane-bound lytic murein transglycosylase MltF